MNKFPYRLYLVTDTKACLGRDLLWVTEQAVKGGVDLVQIREKEISDDAFLEKAIQLKEMLDTYKVPLIVNDRLAIAIQSKAAGIHVGANDLSPMKIKEQWHECQILGYSLEWLDQLNTKEVLVSDYIALSPVFSTITKTNTITEWGLEGIEQVRALTDKPIITIGNMNATNAADVIKAGADCLSVVSAICSANDPQAAAVEIRTIIERSL